MAKPTKIVHRYESWRGTAKHLVELAQALVLEIERARKNAKEKADKDTDAFLQDSRIQFEQNLRTRAGLPPGTALPPNLQTELANAVLRAEAYRDQRRSENEQLITQSTKVSFGYVESTGHSLTSSSPVFLANITKQDGIFMRGWVLASPTANISVTIQNQPWVAISLEAEGEDPDWVSSAAAPLHAVLSARESRTVRFFRNIWVGGTFGVLVWSMFIPPIASMLDRFGMDRLVAIPLSRVASGDC